LNADATPLMPVNAVIAAAPRDTAAGRATHVLRRGLSALFIAIWAGIIALALLNVSPWFQAAVLKSDSMLPSMRGGDVVVYREVDGVDPADLTVGRIITFQLKGDLVTHRLVAIEGGQLITQGDANEEVDPRPVAAEQVRGLYLFRVPFLGLALVFLRTPAGMAVVLGAIAVVVVSSVLINAIRRARGEAAGETASSRKEADREARALVASDQGGAPG
jgi:signal peptidase I